MEKEQQIQMPAVPFDLANFKQHIDFYEMMLDAAEKRIISKVAPHINQLIANQNTLASKGGAIGSGQADVVKREPKGLSLLDFAVIGTILGAMGYSIYKMYYPGNGPFSTKNYK